MSESVKLPLFPLRGVLLPGGVLSLRIFEPRYCDLVARCLSAQSGFGVVPIQRGREVGKTPEIYPTGTCVEIQDWDQGNDGLLHIDVGGEQRFDVEHTWVESDGLMMGEVTLLPQEHEVPLPEEHRRLATLLRAMQEQMRSSLGFTGEPRYEDAVWVSNRLLEHVPMPSDTRQTLCEIREIPARLVALSRLLDQLMSHAER